MVQAFLRSGWLVFGLAALLLLGYACGIASGNAAVARFNRAIELPIDRPFPDAVGLLAAADTARHGGDPYLANPFDPYRRRFNYPPPVLRLVAASGLGIAQTRLFGIATAVVFVAAAGLLFRGLTLRGALLLGAFLLSQPAFLGIENGNIDLLIFALVVCSLAARPPAAAAAGLFAAAILKLFPFFALSLGIREASWRRRTPWILAVLAFCAYAAAISGRLGVIRRNAPPQYWASWGDHTIIYHFGVKGAPWLSRAAAVALIAAGLAAGRRLGRRRDFPVGETEARFAWAGSSLVIGAYFLGTNHNYRLVFLLCILPLLIRVAERRGSGPARLAAAAGLLVLFPLFWNWAIYCRGAACGMRLGVLEEGLPLCAVGICGGVLGLLSRDLTLLPARSRAP